MKKMTYVEALELAISTIDNEEAAERLNALKSSLVKRADHKSSVTSQKNEAKAEFAEADHKSSVASQKNEAKAEFAETIFNAMTAGEKYTTNDIQGLIPELDKASPTKISSYMRLLGDKIVIEKIKGKVHYSIA